MDIGIEYVHSRGQLYSVYEIGRKTERIPPIPFIPFRSNNLNLREIRRTLDYFKKMRIRGWKIYLEGNKLILKNKDCKVRYTRILSTKIGVPSIYHAGKTTIYVDLINGDINLFSELGHPHANVGRVCLGDMVKRNISFSPLLPIRLIEWAETYVGTNPYSYLNAVYCIDTRKFETAWVLQGILYFLDKKKNFLKVFGSEGLFINHRFFDSTLSAPIPQLSLGILKNPFKGKFRYLNREIKDALKLSKYLYFRGSDVAIVFDTSKVKNFNRIDRAFLSGESLPDEIVDRSSYDLRNLKSLTSFEANIPSTKK